MTTTTKAFLLTLAIALSACTDDAPSADPTEIAFQLDRDACRRASECIPAEFADAWGGTDAVAVDRCANYALRDFGAHGDVATADACTDAIAASGCKDTRWGTTTDACAAWFPGGF